MPPDPTVASPVAASDVADHFPSEADLEPQASLRMRLNPALAATTAGTVADFSTEFPSEKDGTHSAQARADAGAASRPPMAPWPAVLRRPINVAWIAAGCALIAVAEAGVIARLIYLRSANPSSATGLVARQSTQTVPNGSRGSDPARSSLGSGPPISPLGGAAAALSPGSPSQLDVTSDPPGARVTVDDQIRGSTPVTMSVSPGPHTVVVSNGTTTWRKTVDAVAGGTETVLASFAPAVVSAGWAAIRSPLELQVREGDSLLGVTSADRLMLPSGRHVLDLSNADAQFQTRLTVVVETGKTTTSTVAIPNGSLSLNALPWASVTLDGQALPGTTPFANLQVPLGPHTIVWTHPQLGERRQTVVVSAKAPVRIVADLTVK